MLTSAFTKFNPSRKNVRKYLATTVSCVLLISSYSAALGADKEDTYKLRVSTQSTGNASGWSLNGTEDSEEWVVMKVKDNRSFKMYHTSLVMNKMWGTRQWFDHPVTSMRICLTDGFEKKDCQVIESDTATIPAGKKLHDLSIDFKYSESGRSFTKNVSIAKDAKPS
jgi:hypothetical protein